METAELLKSLFASRAHDTILPVLHLWLLNAFVFVIVNAIYNTFVAGLVLTFGVILWSLQKEETKMICRQWWIELPAYKFHLMCVIVEAGVLFYIAKFTKFIVLSNTVTHKYGEYDK